MQAAAATTAAAAAVAAPVLAIGTASMQQHQDEGGLQLKLPPDFVQLTREGQPMQCHHTFVKKKKAEMERKLLVVARALEPGAGILSVEKHIGQGTFGGVTMATCKPTNTKWAIKRVVEVSEFDSTRRVDDARLALRCP